jgi:membrane AbrB-like protein
MGAGMIVAGRGSALRVPVWTFALAQAVVGCLIARSFTTSLFHTVGRHIILFVSVAGSVLLVATALGVLLTKLRVLPGSTALWGSFPDAATVLVLLSDSFGGDMRLVALMQYLRVVMVALTASLVGRFWGLPGAAAHSASWLAPVSWPSFAVLLALILLGGLVAPRLCVPAGPLLVPMVLATVLQDAAGLRVELPRPLLAVSYVLVGWAIGLRFTRDVFSLAARALPRVLGSTAALIAACAGIGWVLARVTGIDALTAYFATSPGGADSIAIIAASTPVDLSFVMAVQTGRFVSVLLLGPTLARRAARFTSSMVSPSGG